MSGFSEILYDVRDRVATITFNRPDRNNAWTPTMEAELRDAIAQASGDTEARCIVLTGAGRSFCVGADREALRTAVGGSNRPALAIGPGDYEKQYSYLLGCPKPLIAAINGPAAGVGFCLLLYCDLRYVRAGTKISSSFTRLGLPAEHSSAWLLPRQIGTMNALEVLLTGKTLSSVEADKLGIAREVASDDFIAFVTQTAFEIANLCSPLALAAVKRQVYDGWRQSLSEASSLGDDLKASCRASEDFKEGIASLIEKRPPKFPGR